MSPRLRQKLAQRTCDLNAHDLRSNDGARLTFYQWAGSPPGQSYVHSSRDFISGPNTVAALSFGTNGAPANAQRILALQRLVGNRAVHRYLRKGVSDPSCPVLKPECGQPDPRERHHPASDRAGSPTTSGKIERFDKTLRQELLEGREPFASLQAAQEAIECWRRPPSPRATLGIRVSGGRQVRRGARSPDGSLVIPCSLARFTYWSTPS